ncbi:MAG: ChbG/HpnK family deacetylase [Marinilabiliales bacterium]|nr:ChbG/HpnK family deacetylase [Marinilabiliales bacterium]
MQPLFPLFAARAEGVTYPAGAGRKMVVRADDVGFSKVCNIGAFETIEKGVVTSADIMLDSPGTEDALERLRALPWISVGWHMHMWGAPVLDHEAGTLLLWKRMGRLPVDSGLISAGRRMWSLMRL